jgi:hypothetical protein
MALHVGSLSVYASISMVTLPKMAMAKITMISLLKHESVFVANFASVNGP